MSPTNQQELNVRIISAVTTVLILTKLEGRFFWLLFNSKQLTVNNCQSDICPGHICPGDIFGVTSFWSNYCWRHKGFNLTFVFLLIHIVWITNFLDWKFIFYSTSSNGGKPQPLSTTPLAPTLEKASSGASGACRHFDINPAAWFTYPVILT